LKKVTSYLIKDVLSSITMRTISNEFSANRFKLFQVHKEAMQRHVQANHHLHASAHRAWKWRVATTRLFLGKTSVIQKYRWRQRVCLAWKREYIAKS